MTQSTDRTEVDPAWERRVAQASIVGDLHRAVRDAAKDEGLAEALAWHESIDPTSHVGSRHHVVPAFLLRRWAHNSQVRVRSKIAGTTRTSNVADLAITDFYTFVRKDGSKDSTFEALLGEVERAASRIIDQIFNPFVRHDAISTADVARLAQFTAFQVVRGPRTRRAAELQCEWFAKQVLGSTIPSDELASWTITPHQNTVLKATLPSAEDVVPFLLNRPLTIVWLDSPMLLITDEPVVTLGDRAGTHHHPACQAGDSAQPRRKKKGRRLRTDRQVVHFWSTAEHGLGVADEIVIPVGPSTALHWGALELEPQVDKIATLRLTADESDQFAAEVNGRQCDQALDWIISTRDDDALVARDIPPLGPLIGVCDGGSAASAHLQTAPNPARPHRLTAPAQERVSRNQKPAS